MKYILLDTETTGTQDEDRICQLSFIVKSSEERLVYDEYCDPQRPLSVDAMSVNHITPQMLEGKPQCTQTKAFQTLNALNTPQNVMIGHNIGFDLVMLEKEGFKNQMKLIDTFRCMRHLRPDLPSHALQKLQYQLKLYESPLMQALDICAHNALYDVTLLEVLMSYLLGLIEQNKLAKLIDLSSKPAEVLRFSFGKHAGQKIADVAKTDMGYLRWMLTQKIDDADLAYTIKKYANG
ncbi:MAG: DNA polymerase III subunit epsilon [Deltaproteobacteria bacterium]|nr:MAG: DNA polymerase III subunit epsilon [Deltaproteobacteria bacterium]